MRRAKAVRERRDDRGLDGSPLPFLNGGMIVADIDEALRETGLRCRGAFWPRAEDLVPGDAGTIVLIGNVGSSLWPAFASAVDETARARERHPLDLWTQSVVAPVANGFGARVAYPFEGPPYYPFLRWAQRASGLHPSPIGPFIDPDYGLWHAYRAALLFAERLPVPAPPARPSPCKSCSDSPCLNGCPVGAIRRHHADVAACLTHVRSPNGADCRERGCRARRSCPVGAEHRYGDAQASFHMAKFMQNRGVRAGE